jgi:hypothetical protein
VTDDGTGCVQSPLLAFKDGEPSVWIETKCDFVEKSGDAKKSAEKIIKQADTIFDPCMSFPFGTALHRV